MVRCGSDLPFEVLLGELEIATKILPGSLKSGVSAYAMQGSKQEPFGRMVAFLRVIKTDQENAKTLYLYLSVCLS